MKSALLATILATPLFAGEVDAQSLKYVAPVAEQSGLGPGASLVQDEAFALVAPDTFAALQRERSPQLAAEHRALAMARASVASTLKLPHSLEGRIKSMYSLHDKMQRKGLSMDEVLDRVAIRVVVDDEDAAYAARQALWERFALIEDSVDDYIQHPKASGYQALHQALLFAGQPVEVQIRTRAAHHMAEHGDAAHWRYKLG